MIRSFGKINGSVKLIEIGKKFGYLKYSRYVSESYRISSTSKLIDFLNDNGRLLDEAIIISCSDEVSKELDLNYNRLRNKVSVFNCQKQGEIVHLMDKHFQTELVKKYGLIVPESLKINNSGFKDVNFEIFPCIAKPCSSYNGGKHIVVCCNKHDLGTALSAFAPDVEIIVQQLIYKKYEIVIPGASVNGKAYMPGVVLKHRDSNGATTYSTIKPHDSETERLSANLAKLFEELKYTGLFGVEFIFDGNDYYFIELNLRNDATAYSFDFADTSISKWYINELSGYACTRLPLKEQFTSMVEFNDFSFVLRRKLGLLEWRKQLKDSKGLFYYDKDDLKAFYYALYYWIKSWTIDKLIR